MESGAIAIRSLSEVKEDLMRPSHVTGRVVRVQTRKEHQLEHGYFLPRGHSREIRAGETFVVFQNARESHVPVPRAYLALEPVRIDGPAAFMMTDGVDVVSLHLAEVSLDDDLQIKSRGETMFGAVVALAVGVAAVEAIGYFTGHGPLGLLLRLLLVASGGYFIALYGISVWHERGKKARKRIEENVADGVELFLPKVLRRINQDEDPR
jgi:hypothetical protein